MQSNDDGTRTQTSVRPRALSKGMRRTLIWLGGVIAVLAILEWIEWPFLRQPVETIARRALGRDVTVDAPFGIRFVGHLRVRADRLVIGPVPDVPDLSQQGDLARATGLRLSVPYATLISLLGRQDSGEEVEDRPVKRPYISVLDVQRLEATLVRNADGRANWRFGSQDKEDTAPLALPEFGRLAIADGKIGIDDALKGFRVNATVRSGGAAATTPPAEQNAASGLEIEAKGNYREQNFSAHARTGALSTLADATSGGTAPLWMEVRVGSSEFDFDGQVRNLTRLDALDGKFRLKASSLAAVGDVIGLTLPTTASFVMDGRAVREGAVWSAMIRELAIGSSRLRGDFRYDPTLAVPKLTGQLGGARLSLPDLGPVVGASTSNRRTQRNERTSVAAADKAGTKSAADSETPPTRPQTAPAGTRVLPQREFDTPSLARMEADVAVALDEFHLGTDQLEKMAPFRARVLLENRQLLVRDIAARMASGEVGGVLTFDARPETALWKAELRWSGIQLERFVKPRNIADSSASSGYISGILGGHARLSGSGRSTAHILSTLDGDVQMWVRDGKISHFFVELLGLDIAQALGILVRGDAVLPMQCAVTAFAVRKGKMTPEAALIETTDSTLTASGAISLADERLGLIFRSQPKDISPMSLRAPVFVEGTFADPEVRLDKRSIGLRLMAAAALAAVTPFAAVLALVDLGEPEKKACQEAIQRLQTSRQRSEKR